MTNAADVFGVTPLSSFLSSWTWIEIQVPSCGSRSGGSPFSTAASGRVSPDCLTFAVSTASSCCACAGVTTMPSLAAISFAVANRSIQLSTCLGISETG